MKAYKKLTVLSALTVLLLTACGGDADEPGNANAGKRSIATITFENGEVLSARVACVLEPQVAAGQEILYTATSTSNPYFDITVYGPNSMFEGAKMSWNDTDDFQVYRLSWDTNLPMAGGDFKADLDGKTITGSGTFIHGKDETGLEGEKKQVSVVVRCVG